jgi:enoyl-CoA hydratase
MIRRLKQTPTMRAALELEYRFTYRAMEHSAFLEGIRAAIIDKDRSPKWRYNSPVDVSAQDIEQMLAPLGAATLTF